MLFQSENPSWGRHTEDRSLLSLMPAGSALIWILALVLGAAYVFAIHRPMVFKPIAHAVAYRAGFAESRLVDVWSVNCTSVSDTAENHNKIVEILQRLSKPCPNLTVFDYRPEHKERNRISWNKDSLIQGFHFVLNLIEWRTQGIEGNHRPSFDQFCGRLANIFYRPSKADIPVIQKTRTFRLFHVCNDPRALGINHHLDSFESGIRGAARLVALPRDHKSSSYNGPNRNPFGPRYEYVPPWQVILAAIAFVLAGILLFGIKRKTASTTFLAVSLIFFGGCMLLSGHEYYYPYDKSSAPYQCDCPDPYLPQSFKHNSVIVPQQYFDSI